MSMCLTAQIQFKNVNTLQLTVEEGLAMSRVDDLVCDKQNILWIKTNRGLQFWDGKQVQTFQDSILNVGTYFHMYAHPEEGVIVSIPGLVRQFTFEGLSKEVLYESNRIQNEFVPIALNSKYTDAILIHPDSIYVYNSKDLSSTKYIEKQSSDRGSTVHQYSYDGRKYVVDFNSHNSFENKTNLFEKVISKHLMNPIRNTILLDSSDVILSTKNGLQFFNGESVVNYSYPDNLKANYYSALLNIDDRKILVGMDNVLCEFDKLLKKWTGIYKNIDQDNLLETGYFDKLIVDNYNNIWAVTVNEGLLKIYNNESFQYFGTGNKEFNFVKNILIDENSNRVINSALNGGILVYDTLGNLTHHLDKNNTYGQVKSVTGIYHINPNQYIFNNHRDSMIYELSFIENVPKIKQLKPKRESYLYYQDGIKIDSTTSFLLFNTLYRLQHNPFELTPLFQYTSTKSCMKRDNNTLWIGCIDGIIKYKIGNGNGYEFIKLPGEGYVRSISTWKENTLALGSDKGLSIFDKTNYTLEHIHEGCIYCLLNDGDDNVWAGTGSGIIRIDQQFKKTQYSKIDGLQNNEFNTNACIKSSSGKMYFGGVNGISAFAPKEIPISENAPLLYINSLNSKNGNLVLNSRISKIDHLRLPYDENNLNISVGAIGKYESDKYNYQYYIKGASSEWINAKDQTQYNFNLSPGNYKCYFKASKAFEANAALTNPLLITIKKPWWNQWWFYLLSLFSFASVISYLIRAKEKQKYLKKKYEWDLEYQRQEDRIKMSKELHDNIGSRLTFLVTSIENIKKAFQSNSIQAIDKIDNLTDFGKDTIEDLRSMMWVLSQQTITLQDLQLKILDYLNIAKNTYRNIDFQYTGPQSELSFELDSKLSQNIFRIIQESIHNSIKYASPSVISIHISFENPVLDVTITDDGKGFEPEKVKLGNGIHNIKSRLAEFDSKLNITSNIGQGTKLHFSLLTNKITLDT